MNKANLNQFDAVFHADEDQCVKAARCFGLIPLIKGKSEVQNAVHPTGREQTIISLAWYRDIVLKEERPDVPDEMQRIIHWQPFPVFTCGGIQLRQNCFKMIRTGVIWLPPSFLKDSLLM
jgi:hypothetical protein